MRGLLVCTILALALAGCRRAGDETVVIIEEPLSASEADAPPRPPIVSCTRLVEKDGRMFLKDTGQPFTGSTVTYTAFLSEGFSIRELVDGVAGEWKMLPDDMAPTDPRCRDAFHQEVARRGPDHNDYMGYYFEYGDESDLPALFYDLKQYPLHREENRTWADCERGHCLDALKRITGANPGGEDEDWATWWRQKYGTEPFQWKPSGDNS